MLIFHKYKMLLKKGQSAIEFIMLVAGVLLFFTIFFMILQNNTEMKYTEKNNLLIKQTAHKIKDEIDLATTASEGYSRVFKIPEKIGNREYNATIQEGMIYLITHDEKYAIAIPTKPVNGNLEIGENLIEKKNKEVYLNDF